MAKVKLNHEAREYLHFPVSHLPADLTGIAMEVRFPPTVGWATMEWVTVAGDVWTVWDGVSGAPTHARVLVAGPDVDAGGGVALEVGDSAHPELRLTSNPEVIIRTSSVVVSVLP